MSIISVNNLSKQYRIGQRQPYKSLRETLMNIVKSPARLLSLNGSKEDNTIWALKDVSFEVKEGDVIGIIGRNGAGKTTLLKILSRVTEPTEGMIKLRGRVASLLEVGTGFHPELTGRENIFLNGSILGMSRQEIKSKFDEIVAFAEIEKFIDTPVKKYSSGMYVRLAFAVAAHLEPEILIIDEVLAVGDAQFQKKCLGKMGEVAKGGRTVLFVSHNLPAIQRLCDTGIYLEAGTIKSKGAVTEVLSTYQESLLRNIDSDQSHVSVRDGEVKFVAWRLHPDERVSPHSCYSREMCRIVFTLVAKRKILNAYIGFAIWSLEGDLIFAASSLDNNGQYANIHEGVHHVVWEVRLPLKAGGYQMDISLNSQDSAQIDRWAAYPKLSILPLQNTLLPEHWHGILNEKASFTLLINADELSNQSRDDENV